MVSWDDFFKFHFCVQSHLKDIKLAFELTGAEEITEGIADPHIELPTDCPLTTVVAPCPASAAEFIRAAQVVSGVELSLPVVKLAFRIFDSNGACRTHPDIRGSTFELELTHAPRARPQTTAHWTGRSCSRCSRCATSSTCAGPRAPRLSASFGAASPRLTRPARRRPPKEGSPAHRDVPCRGGSRSILAFNHRNPSSHCCSRLC